MAREVQGMKPRALPACLCLPECGFVCSLHRNTGHAQSIEEADALADEAPDRLAGYGHRMADQDGGDGEEWVSPAEDHANQMIEAARVLLEATEI